MVSDSYNDLPSRYTSPVCQVLTWSKNQSPPMRSRYGLRDPNREFGTVATQTRPAEPGVRTPVGDHLSTRDRHRLEQAVRAQRSLVGDRRSSRTAARRVHPLAVHAFVHDDGVPRHGSLSGPVDGPERGSADPSARSEPVVVTCRMSHDSAFHRLLESCGGERSSRRRLDSRPAEPQSIDGPAPRPTSPGCSALDGASPRDNSGPRLESVRPPPPPAPVARTPGRRRTARAGSTTTGGSGRAPRTPRA